MIKQVTAVEAKALQDDGATYVDVRSTREFEAGHPEGASNVPLLEVDVESGQMLPNPDFVRVMQANFTTETRLVIGCQAGVRSMQAIRILQQFGFSDLANVAGGFGGARMGPAADPGWAASGLPIARGRPEGRSYPDLVARADRDA